MGCARGLCVVAVAIVASGWGCDSGGGSAATGPGGARFGNMVSFVEVDFAEDLTVHRDVAYVCAKREGVSVVDVANPLRPQLLTRLGTTDAWDAAALGDHLLIADREGGLLLLDVSAPASPKALTGWSPGWSVNAVVVDSAGRVWAAGSSGPETRAGRLDLSGGGLTLKADYSESTSPEGGAISVAASGEVAWMGRNDGTVVGVRLAEGIIEKVAQFNATDADPNTEWALGLWLDGDTLYVADWAAGLLVVDVSAPESPRYLARWTAGNANMYDVWASGDRAYVASDLGLAVLDVTDKAAPSLIGDRFIATTIHADDGQHGVWLAGDIAYVADNKEKKLTLVYVGE